MSIQKRLLISGNFPAAEIETCIRNALAAEHAAQKLLRPQPVNAWEPDVDSLVAMEVICAIEELLGMSLPTSFAPRGGYDDVEACVSDLLAETSAIWVQMVETVKQTENQHA